MEQIFERFSATELDNVLYATNKYERGNGFSTDELQTNIWLDNKIAPPIADAIEAIMHYNKDLITITNSGKSGKRYKPGAYLQRFLNYGGFKKVYEKQVSDESRKEAEKNVAHKANLALVDAAVFAKRSADASEISVSVAARFASAADRSASLAKQALIVAIITALLSLVALVKTFMV